MSNNVENYFNRGIEYYNSGEYDKALEAFNKVIELDGEYKKAYYNRGVVYKNLGRYDIALLDYSKAIKLDDKYKEAYYNIGILYDKSGIYLEALKNFNRAIEIDVDYKEAYNYRGIVYYKLGEYDKALEDFNKAIEIDPAYKYAYYNIGIIYLIKHDEKDTEIKKLERIIDLAIKKIDLAIKKDDNKKVSLNILNLLKEILIDNTYNLEDSQKVILIKLIIECYDLMEKCEVGNDKNKNDKDKKDKKFIHYTKSSNLKFLLKKEKKLKDEDLKDEEPRFRLSHTMHMNDPEEGKILKKYYLINATKIPKNI